MSRFSFQDTGRKKRCGRVRGKTSNARDKIASRKQAQRKKQENVASKAVEVWQNVFFFPTPEHKTELMLGKRSHKARNVGDGGEGAFHGQDLKVRRTAMPG